MWNQLINHLPDYNREVAYCYKIDEPIYFGTFVQSCSHPASVDSRYYDVIVNEETGYPETPEYWMYLEKCKDNINSFSPFQVEYTLSRLKKYLNYDDTILFGIDAPKLLEICNKLYPNYIALVESHLSNSFICIFKETDDINEPFPSTTKLRYLATGEQIDYKIAAERKLNNRSWKGLSDILTALSQLFFNKQKPSTNGKPEVPRTDHPEKGGGSSIGRFEIQSSSIAATVTVGHPVVGKNISGPEEGLAITKGSISFRR